MGAKADAIGDMAKALILRPIILRQIGECLDGPTGDQQIKAALTLIDYDRDLSPLSKSIQVLQKHGQRRFANVTVRGNTIEGWAIWDDKADLEVSITGSASNGSAQNSRPDARHPLAGYGHAVDFSMRRPKLLTNLQSILLFPWTEAYSEQPVRRVMPRNRQTVPSGSSQQATDASL